MATIKYEVHTAHANPSDPTQISFVEARSFPSKAEAERFAMEELSGSAWAVIRVEQTPVLKSISLDEMLDAKASAERAAAIRAT